MSKQAINDKDRAMWIDVNESLQNLWKQSRRAKRAFIKDNRAEIDKVIRSAIAEQEQANRVDVDLDANL